MNNACALLRWRFRRTRCPALLDACRSPQGLPTSRSTPRLSLNYVLLSQRVAAAARPLSANGHSSVTPHPSLHDMPPAERSLTFGIHSDSDFALATCFHSRMQPLPPRDATWGTSVLRRSRDFTSPTHRRCGTAFALGILLALPTLSRSPQCRAARAAARGHRPCCATTHTAVALYDRSAPFSICRSKVTW